MATEPSYNEQDVEDSVGLLPEGGESLPMTDNERESVSAFHEMFDNAWIH